MQLSRDQKFMLAELMQEDGNVIAAIGEAVRARMFREFENVQLPKGLHAPDHRDNQRIAIGRKIDVLADVMREFKTIANEVAVSGRIDRIA